MVSVTGVKVKTSMDQRGLKKWFYSIPCSDKCSDNSALGFFNRKFEVTLYEQLTIARYIQAIVNLFINKVLLNQKVVYDAHLFFKRI